MKERIRFIFSRLQERLWVKPLISCVLSIIAVLVAGATDAYYPQTEIMSVSKESLKTLLTIISSSMLVMATFAVGSMLSAYLSVSRTATPRAFSIVIADDVSQYALSVFIGAFIFGIIGLIALMNGFYQENGRLVMLLLTIVVFIIVILGFVRWVDNIARLGTLGNTITKVETVTANALNKNRKCPTHGAATSSSKLDGCPLYAEKIGYLQRIDMSKLQATAEKFNLTVNVNAMVGALVLPTEPLAYIISDTNNNDLPKHEIVSTFLIGRQRTFDEDPRFGLVVLSEIASRALSPAVNDPGTAIDIIGALGRLLNNWAHLPKADDGTNIEFNRITVPEILLDDMFDDAFNAIARDGAANVEVTLRLLKVYKSLATINDDFKDCTSRHANKALRHAEQGLCLPEEFELLKDKIKVM